MTGDQWAAVANCGPSIAICLRNFRTQSDQLGPSLVIVETDESPTSRTCTLGQRR